MPQERRGLLGQWKMVGPGLGVGAGCTHGILGVRGGG